MQAIWKIIYIVLYSFLFALFYIVSCVLVYTVSFVLGKSSGSFFIMHLILLLSLSIIVAILGKLILLSLKVTLTSFQSISKVSQV